MKSYKIILTPLANEHLQSITEYISNTLQACDRQEGQFLCPCGTGVTVPLSSVSALLTKRFRMV